MQNILVTGGLGFIGSNFIKYMFTKYDNKINIVNLDLITYAGNLENLIEEQTRDNYIFIKGDIQNEDLVSFILKEYKIDTLVNFAAESHVDRSILEPDIFVKTNVLGTLNLLNCCKKHGIHRFLQVSTDEVYGALGKEGLFTEKTDLKPNSPYSASKTSADLLARAYHKTFDMPILITRCSNNYGPYQFPEKLIPLMIMNLLNNKKLPVYGDGKQVRDWLYVLDHCEAIDVVLNKGKIGEVYNIGGNNEMENIEIVKLLIKHLNKSEDMIEYVKDRLGHDRRYAIDASKIKNELGWEPKYKFENALPLTIKWYLDNKSWWEKIISGEYKNYYKNMYENR
jgi:dTDP-glucose 4,6-dehydratase